jgi:hypothetical protein
MDITDAHDSGAVMTYYFLAIAILPLAKAGQEGEKRIG